MSEKSFSCDEHVAVGENCSSSQLSSFLWSLVNFVIDHSYLATEQSKNRGGGLS